MAKIIYTDVNLVDNDLTTTGQITANNISLGTASPAAGFNGAGDIYATKNFKVMEGAFAEAAPYGTGLEVSDNALATTYTNIVYGDATLTAATQVITDTHASFDSTYVGQYLRVASSTPSFAGAVGEIIAVNDGTHLVVSFGTAGSDTIVDATAASFVIYPHPIFFVGDNGDIHAEVGVNQDASFKIHADDSNNDHAIHFVATAGIDGNSGLDIEYDAHTYNNTKAISIDFDATAFSDAEDMGTGIDINVDNTGSSAGDFHAIEVSKGDVADNDMEVEALTTRQGVEPVGQYLSTAATLDAGFSYTPTTYTDRKAAFDASGTNVQVFVLDDDFILVAAAAKFDVVDVLLNIPASHTIIPAFHYIEDDGDWVAFSPSDETTGFQNNGSIRWVSANLTTWGVRTVNEVTGAGDAVDDLYWIKITRTRAILPTPPTESVISVRTAGSKFYWNKTGDTFTNSMAVVDGITAPTTISGQAIIYVDTSDGDLKVKFGDGFVATLAVDS